MKTVFLSIFMGLFTMVGFSQAFYPYKKDEVRYFGVYAKPSGLLEHLGISYCSPGNRLIVSESRTKEFMEYYSWNEDRIQISFDKHKNSSITESEFSLVPDVNRVIMTEKEFFLKNDWNDEFSSDMVQIMSNMGSVIIGMKEWEIPVGTKPWVAIDYLKDINKVVFFDSFQSIMIVELYLPTTKQVTSRVFIRTKTSQLIYCGSSLDNLVSGYTKDVKKRKNNITN